METTTIILIVGAVAIVLMIYLRFYKKKDDAIIPEQDPRKDEYYDSPETETSFKMGEEDKDESIDSAETESNLIIEEANKEFDIPDEEITRIIADQEIQQLTDEHEREIIRITNYFISNGLKNLAGTNFFNIQENILLAQSDQPDLYADIHQIFQITENRFIAIIDLPGTKIQVEDRDDKKIKAILGIIECRKNIGKGRLAQLRGEKERLEENEEKENEEAELIAEIFLPETDKKIGNNLLHASPDIDMTTIESLSCEIEKLSRDYIAYINGSSVYIRINRPACLDDVKILIDILMEFQC
jgi:hypothetical protein